MPKSPDAFRTISEVAEWLGVQAHVLRFWESKFAQIKPIKRAGGRRYYRPADMLLLGGIKKLLHDDGLTIKGAQKLLREKGVAFVADQSQPLDDLTIAVIEGDAQDVMKPDAGADLPDAATETLEPITGAQGPEAEGADGAEDAARASRHAPAVSPEPMPDDQRAAQVEEYEHAQEPSEFDGDDEALIEPSTPGTPATAETAARTGPPKTETVAETDEERSAVSTPSGQETPATDDPYATDELRPLDEKTPPVAAEPAEDVQDTTPLPSFRARPRSGVENAAPEIGETPPEPQTAPEDDALSSTETADVSDTDAEAPAVPPAPKVVDVPPVPSASEIPVDPSVLSALSRVRHISPEHAREIKPLVARLTRLRASMASPRKDTHKD